MILDCKKIGEYNWVSDKTWNPPVKSLSAISTSSPLKKEIPTSPPATAAPLSATARTTTNPIIIASIIIIQVTSFTRDWRSWPTLLTKLLIGSKLWRNRYLTWKSNRGTPTQEVSPSPVTATRPSFTTARTTQTVLEKQWRHHLAGSSRGENLGVQ